MLPSNLPPNNSPFNKATQFAIPTLTISMQLAIAMKRPEYGLIFSFVAQPFWIYSAHRSYKEAGQIGLFITTVTVAVIVTLGLANYWIFS